MEYTEEEKKAIENLRKAISINDCFINHDLDAIFKGTMKISINIVLNLLEKQQKEIGIMREYIFVAPNLDEMTAVKYQAIQEGAYLRGRKEEQEKAEQIIYKNYIPKEAIREKLDEQYKLWNTPNRQKEYSQELVDAYEELLGE